MDLHGARLYDANLSPALVALLRADYPDSIHVRDVGLRQGSDADIGEHAKTNTMVIVSKDTDFREGAFVDGPPPLVIWIDAGNAGTRAIESLLRREKQQLSSSPDVSLLILSIGPGAV